MTFASPYYLLLLLLIIPYIVWYKKWRNGSEVSMRISDVGAYRNISPTLRQRLVHAPFILRCMVLTLLVIILARPQTSNSWRNTSVEGINIMLAMDVSTSMLSTDFSPNRIEVAKKVASEFIADRPNDNIGLTVFAGESYTQCPMTTDHASLLNILDNVRTDLAATGLLQDGTALGMGLSNALARLKDVKAKSKMVILLTDGSNNMGAISPMTAAGIAKSLGIRVYTIAIGKEGVVQYPMMVGGRTEYIPVESQIDTKTLQEISATTNGESYHATSASELRKIYNDIDKLEKTKFDVRKYDRRYDAYLPFAILAFILLLTEIILRQTLLKKIP
ncbi:MAG: VWA domain-containing protein [Prevotella sp.]|nr:VWA domain-containing protein [Candidatus Equicola faecalis]